jgi:hypothetical protein
MSRRPSTRSRLRFVRFATRYIIRYGLKYASRYSAIPIIAGSPFEPSANSRESGAKGAGFAGRNAFSGQCENLEQSERFLHLLVARDILEHRFGFAIDGDDDGVLALASWRMTSGASALSLLIAFTWFDSFIRSSQSLRPELDPNSRGPGTKYSPNSVYWKAPPAFALLHQTFMSIRSSPDLRCESSRRQARARHPIESAGYISAFMRKKPPIDCKVHQRDNAARCALGRNEKNGYQRRATGLP